MPLYEYECPKGHRIERVASITAPGEPLDWIECPSCPRTTTVVPRRGRRRVNLKIVRAELVQSLTGKPKFKKGIGGFHSPNA